MAAWVIQSTIRQTQESLDEILAQILTNRGITTKKERERFLNPPDPATLTTHDVGIRKSQFDKALTRIQKAIEKKESIVVYADYDTDGITAGAIMWEALYILGAQVMPYVPHRVEEGYGLSKKGIDKVKVEYNPSLCITVDHGITAYEKVAYAKKCGIDVIVTDHHIKSKILPKCPIVHTTKLSGAGIAWFIAHALLSSKDAVIDDLLSLAAIGTIADMVPLIGPNRSIALWGIRKINSTNRPGILELVAEAGLIQDKLTSYDISHILAPRLNAMGRLEHALDALRLLCTRKQERAKMLAQKLGITNRERQQLTLETSLHASAEVSRTELHTHKKLLFVGSSSYNQGIIGLVAGKLVDKYYRPSIVVAIGQEISKASARSITGFNIVEAIRECSQIILDVGGHPMAAGFTFETEKLAALQKQLEDIVEKKLNDDLLTKKLRIDAEIPLGCVTQTFWKRLQDMRPFGIGNPEPVFATRNVTIRDARLVGSDGKHLKLRLQQTTEEQQTIINAIAFNMGNIYSTLRPDTPIDIAYTIDMNEWNGNTMLQIKIKDIHEI